MTSAEQPCPFPVRLAARQLERGSSGPSPSSDFQELKVALMATNRQPSCTVCSSFQRNLLVHSRQVLADNPARDYALKYRIPHYICPKDIYNGVSELTRIKVTL